jgi:hypothetical protein
MPLGFLVPAFLAGLAALAIPLLLHLRQRDRSQPFRFPSLMFLRRIPIETAHRRRVTDLPLLLLRALAVLLAVLAFARPVVQRVGAAIAPAGERVVIVALDRSMSMGHSAVWPAAMDSARAVIAGLAAGDRIGVIAFDDDAVIMQPITTDHAAALAALGTIRPGARGTRFAAALRAARQQLQAGNLATAEVVVVSDLQRSGIGGIADLALPRGITVRGVSVAAASSANRAVSGIAVARLGGGAAGRIAVTAELRGRALGSAQSARATLMVNNREAGSREVEVPADGMVSAAFDPVALPPGEARVTVTLTPDALAADDRFRAVVPAEASQLVLLVSPGDMSGETTLFLERALAIGTDPAFRVERRSAASLDAASLARAAVVLLIDVAPPATPVFRTWIESGHGAVVVAGPRLGASRVGVSAMPARGDGEVDRLADRGGTLGDVSLEHPVFVPFRAGGSAALSSARFIRYARLVADSGAQVLARFDDGLPALVEGRIGTGRLLVSAIPLDARGGDFPLQPAYLPFVRRLALHAAGYQPQPLWRTAGEGWRPAAAVRDLVIATPSEVLVRPDSGGTQGAATLDELGFYQAYQERAVGEPVSVVAVNPPTRESDLTPSPASELLVGIAPELTAAPATEILPADEAEQRQRLWRILLLLVLAVLVGESVLGSSGWRGRAMRAVPDLPGGGAL